jgi:predicted HicB family RNase H-like nuclease
MTMNAKHYTYRVTWSAEDGAYVALCAEFPSLSFLAKEPATALNKLTDVVDAVVQDLHANHEPVPVPLAEHTFSGKLMLRMTPEKHRKLAILAAEQGVSLNHYLNHRLS